MSDQEPNHELDNELLSAYLDGELSADEHAAVEARLVADPAAQRLLDQLRSVSQSVQELPPKTFGRDLTDEIVRRARDVKPAPAEAPATRFGNTMPRITIFGSRRAWFWASLAMAAGLLIMFFQSDNERAKNSHHVAQNAVRELAEQPPGPAATPAFREPSTNRQFASNRNKSRSSDGRLDQIVGSPSAQAQVQAIDQLHDSASSNAPVDAPIAAATTSPTSDRDNLSAASRSRATSAPSPAALSKLAKPSVAAGRASALGGALTAAAPGSGESNLFASQNQLVIVHVVATRDAIQNKSFERLLADHRIDLVSQSSKDKSPFARGRAFRQQAPELGIKLADKFAAGQDAHFVLVEAPEPAIVSCLASLHKDSANFVGIDIDQSGNVHDRADEASRTNKKLADDLRRFSRGVVPREQMKSIDRYNPNFVTAAPAAPGAGAASAAMPAKASIAENEAKQLVNGPSSDIDKNEVSDTASFARRTQSRNVGAREEASQRLDTATELRSGSEAKKAPASQPLPEESAAPSTDEMRVLFVLSPGQAASSPPPANPPK
ncbi:MAG TPA: zf-HC2 domain-containing protein [Lacipirellulaceae bacterium]|nr:zf-HC2 domain-containing protein [Lacipirellulaceae bacterium]